MCVLIGIDNVPLSVQEDTIKFYQLKQEIASLREERDIIIFENKELKSEIEQIKSQLLAVPTEEEGTVGVAHLHCHLRTSFV